MYCISGTLKDTDEYQRLMGITAGLAWMEVADAVVFYLDYGMSPGMRVAWEHAELLGKQCDQRWIMSRRPVVAPAAQLDVSEPGGIGDDFA
jgi:hypothetical protein